MIHISKILAMMVLIANLKVVYFFLKVFPINKKKVLFISRQNDNVSIDYQLIIDKLKEVDKKIDVVVINKRINLSILSLFSFYLATLKQMYHLATSKICIIDGYCIPVSVLKHKQDLVIIQIWHALGKIKQSGYQTIGKRGGRDAVSAKLLKMHNNYSYTVASSTYWNKFYCASFNICENTILNYGLPRIDYLINKKDELYEVIKQKYPDLFKKKIILYAPTFRRNRRVDFNNIIDNIDFDRFNLIIKLHPTEKNYINKKDNIFLCDEFNTNDLLTICDYLITDYSSIAFEALVIDTKILFYIYDYEEYLMENGLNIDLRKEVSSFIFEDIEKLFDYIDDEQYDFKLYNRFKEKFLPKELGVSTNKITNFIIKKIKE